MSKSEAESCRYCKEIDTRVHATIQLWSNVEKWVRKDIQPHYIFIFVYFLFSSGMESQDITYNDYMDTFKFAHIKQRHNIITENKHG